jgi:prevent-host-death family protein
MPISRFKATCLAAIERVRRTGRPLLITKRGVPVAQVMPPPAVERGAASTFGALASSVAVVGDLIEPLGEDEWEALR